MLRDGVGWFSLGRRVQPPAQCRIVSGRDTPGNGEQRILVRACRGAAGPASEPPALRRGAWPGGPERAAGRRDLLVTPASGHVAGPSLFNFAAGAWLVLSLSVAVKVSSIAALR